MPQGTLACKHCGSTKIVNDKQYRCAVVQQKDPETGEPIGPPKTFFMFKCLFCGKGIYLEKFETSFNIIDAGGVGEGKPPAIKKTSQ
jgi:hypothetical protein